VHMSDWNKDAREFVETSGVAQFWVMVARPEPRLQDVAIEASRDMPGRMIPFLHIDWREWAKDPGEVERAYERGAIGLKAIRPPLPYDHESYFPIYEKANALGMPILFHTGIIAHAAYDANWLGRASFGPSNMQPAMLGAIAAAFPELSIIGGHLGYPYTEQTHHNLWYYPNVAHDVCGYAPFDWLIAHLGDRAHPRFGGPGFYYEKILLATDSSLGRPALHGQAMEKYKFWSLFFKFVGRFHSWGDHAEKVLSGNADRIMNNALKKQGRTLV